MQNLGWIEKKSLNSQVRALHSQQETERKLAAYERELIKSLRTNRAGELTRLPWLHILGNFENNGTEVLGLKIEILNDENTPVLIGFYHYHLDTYKLTPISKEQN